MILKRIPYAVIVCAVLCGTAAAETPKKKLYVSALTASGVGAKTARAATDSLVLALLGLAGDRYHVLSDDDIRVLYRQAETAMAAGKSAEEQVLAIAGAVEADEMVYGELRAEGAGLRVVAHCMARQGARGGMFKKSMVDFSCVEADLGYYVPEAARRLIDPSYKMAVKGAAGVPAPSLVPIAVLRFDEADGAMAAALSFLKDELASADAQFEAGRAEEALSAYGAIMERVDGRLADEHRRALKPFRDAVRERADLALAVLASIHDQAGDERYRAWNFAEARQCYDAALLKARKIHGAARRVPLEKALAAKSAAARKTGENHLAGRVRTLLERAQAANVRDEYTGAFGALEEARSLIIGSAFFSAEAFGAYNAAVRVIGGENAIALALGENGVFMTRAGALFRDTEIVLEDACGSETEGQGAPPPRRTKKGDRYGLVESGGRIILDFIYDEIDCYGCGLARFKSGGRWGYLNERGSVRLPAVYDEAESFIDGRATVRRGALWTWINTSGATDPDPDAALSPLLCEEKGLYGFGDGDGRLFIAPRYHDARAFDGALAAVCLANGWGFINRRGTLVAGGWYDEVRGFSEGRAAVKKDGFWGYIDAAGNSILHCTLDEAGDFNNGKADITYRGCRGTAYRNGYFEYYTWR